MFKRTILFGLAVFLVMAGTALAGEGMKGNLSGEITKIDGEMVTVKLDDGKSKSIHIDPSSTKKEGTIEVGAHVTADVNDKGHANWIKVKEMKE